jgi:acyl dehydratase
MPGNTFEDFAPGQVYELGSTTVTEEEIVDFARRFDPQPFHLDAEAAKDSDFGGLIASGWHTGAMWMRLYVDSLLGDGSGQGSSGIEELRWLAPVRPGDTLSGRLTVLETTPSERHPDRGTIRIRGEMVNQDGVTVMSMVSRGRFARRSPQ